MDCQADGTGFANRPSSNVVATKRLPKSSCIEGSGQRVQPIAIAIKKPAAPGTATGQKDANLENLLAIVESNLVCLTRISETAIHAGKGNLQFREDLESEDSTFEILHSGVFHVSDLNDCSCGNERDPQ